MTYVEKLFQAKNENIPKIIKDLCTEVDIDPRLYTDFISTGGIQYILEKLSAEIYLSLGEINDRVRYSIILLYTFENTKFNYNNIFEINNLIANEKSSWARKDHLSKKDSLKEILKKELKHKLKNCATCSDSKNGCRGQDQDCCSPDFIDWRGSDNETCIFLGITDFIA